MKNKTLLSTLILFLLLQTKSTQTMDIIYKYPYSVLVASVKIMRSAPSFFWKQATSVGFWNKNYSNSHNLPFKNEINWLRFLENPKTNNSRFYYASTKEHNKKEKFQKQKDAFLRTISDETWFGGLMERFLQRFGMHTIGGANIEGTNHMTRINNKFNKLKKSLKQNHKKTAAEIEKRLDEIANDINHIKYLIEILKEKLTVMNNEELEQRKTRLKLVVENLGKKLETFDCAIRSDFSETMQNLSNELNDLDVSTNEHISHAKETSMQLEARVIETFNNEKQSFCSQSKKQLKKRHNQSKKRKSKLRETRQFIYQIGLVGENLNHQVSDIHQLYDERQKTDKTNNELCIQYQQTLEEQANSVKDFFVSNPDKLTSKKNTIHFNGLKAGIFAATAHSASPLLQIQYH